MRQMTLLFAVTCSMLFVGCRSPEELVPPVVEQTPLPLDPIDRPDLATWWSNGLEMLRLEHDGRFMLYGDQNRYHPPVLTGKWSRPSYAWIRLEPYTRLGQPTQRVQIVRIDDRTLLELPDRARMSSRTRAPVVLEDGLLGRWVGGFGQLDLAANGTYAFTSTGGTVDDPPHIPGHRGSWRVVDDALSLQPDPMNLGPYRIPLDVEDDRILLTTTEGPLTRTE